MVCRQKNQASDWPTYLVYQLEAYFFVAEKHLNSSPDLYIWKNLTLVVLLYPDISNFTFGNVKILKCKIFLINFLDELGNLKQNFFTLQNVKFFYILKQQTL